MFIVQDEEGWHTIWKPKEMHVVLPKWLLPPWDKNNKTSPWESLQKSRIWIGSSYSGGVCWFFLFFYFLRKFQFQQTTMSFRSLIRTKMIDMKTPYDYHTFTVNKRIIYCPRIVEKQSRLWKIHTPLQRKRNNILSKDSQETVRVMKRFIHGETRDSPLGVHFDLHAGLWHNPVCRIKQKQNKIWHRNFLVLLRKKRGLAINFFMLIQNHKAKRRHPRHISWKGHRICDLCRI